MKRIFILSALAALCLLGASCSVKENRDVCPAFLTVSSDGHIGEPGFSGTLLYNVSTASARMYNRDEGTLKEFTKDGHVEKVPRKENVIVDVIGGIRKMTLTDEVLRIPVGEECDSLVFGSGSAWIPEDLGYVSVPLCRNYAKILMGIVGEVGESYPYYFFISGNVDGYNLPDLTPHVGIFQKRLDMADGEVFECRVPRQVDDQLNIEIRTKVGHEVVTEIPLGAVIRGMNYDWNSRDLDDILINVDFARTMITITVADWTREILIKITI